MDWCLKKRLALAEVGASSKQRSATGVLKMKMKQKRFRSLHDIYKETSRYIYTVKDVEKLSKETQSLKKNRVVHGKNNNGDHQDSSKKLPLEESRQEVEKENYFGNDSTIIISTSKGKEKLSQSKKDGKIILATGSEANLPKAKVQRQQDITLSGQVVTVVEGDDDLLGPGVASPMSSISTNSRSSMIFNNNVEIQTQDKVSKTTFESNSIQDSTGPSSTRKRKVRLFGTDLDSDPMQIPKAVKTNVVTNTHGSEETGHIDYLLLDDLNNAADGFKDSEKGDHVADYSPKGRDFMSGDGDLGTLTLTLGSANALPLVSEERDFLNSFGTHGASGSSPPPPQEANMTSLKNNDHLMLGFIPPQASNFFTVSQRSSFAPYITQQTSVIRNNNPNPLLRPMSCRPGRTYDGITLNNPSTLILASSILPNPSSLSNSPRPADMQVFYGNACPIFLMVCLALLHP